MGFCYYIYLITGTFYSYCSSSDEAKSTFLLGKITWNQRGRLVIYWDYENGKTNENYEYHMGGF